MPAVKPQHFFFIPLLSVFTFVFVGMDNHKLLPYIYIASILACLLFERKLRPQWNTSATIILVVICIFLSIKQIHDFSSSSIRIAISTLVLLLFFPKSILNEKTLSIIILISSIFTAMYVTNQYFFLNLGRGWSVNPILHSTLSSSLLCISYYLALTKQKEIPLINIISCVLFSYCISLSETRGSLLSVLLCITFICIFLFRKNKVDIKKLILSHLTLTVLMISNPTFFNKIYNTVSIKNQIIEKPELHDAKQDLNSTLSFKNIDIERNINYRLQAWLASIDVIKVTFPLGAGGNTKEILKEQLSSSSSLLSSTSFHHFHNQFINSLAIDGILGLLFTILLLTYPIYCLIKYKDESSFIFTIVSIVYASASLTDVLFDSKPTLCLYLTMFIVYQYYSPTTDGIKNKETTNNKQDRLDHASHI